MVSVGRVVALSGTQWRSVWVSPRLSRSGRVRSGLSAGFSLDSIGLSPIFRCIYTVCIYSLNHSGSFSPLSSLARRVRACVVAGWSCTYDPTYWSAGWTTSSRSVSWFEGLFDELCSHCCSAKQRSDNDWKIGGTLLSSSCESGYEALAHLLGSVGVLRETLVRSAGASRVGGALLMRFTRAIGIASNRLCKIKN